MAPSRPNMDVVAINNTPLLTEEELAELRRCDNPEHVPDTNLFAIMFDDGPEWAEARANGYLATGSYSEAELEEKAKDMAKEMTINVQDEHGVCLPDYRVSQMFGMSHDLARLALGIRITAPTGLIKKPKHAVMHKRRIREYAKDQT